MELFHGIARNSVEWMFYCLMEGTALALFTWILLRLLPRQNSGTRFALWFSVLLATIALPFLAGTFLHASFPKTTAPSTAVAAAHSLLTLSESLAFAIFAIWAVIAAIALMRVVVGLWQVKRMRENCEEVDRGSLSAGVRALLQGFPRRVSLRVSDRVQAPAAIGFFKAAVVVPRWFLQEVSAHELEQVLVHELAHLRRRDDWTNLAQKIIKSLLFFHPSVWFVERQLSLEREMACDDAVLAQAVSPRHYAQCLIRLAEKSLVKKRMSLVQGMLSRVRQLSLRVAQIMDVNRPGGTRLWKPAVPLVVAAAAICGFCAWSAPQLIGFQSGKPAGVVGQAQSVAAASREASGQPKLVLASAVVHDQANARSLQPLRQRRTGSRDDARVFARSLLPPIPGIGATRDDDLLVAAARAPVADQRTARNRKSRFLAPLGMTRDHRGDDYVVQAEQVIITMTSDGQVHMWEVRILVPVTKTAPRKNI